MIREVLSYVRERLRLAQAAPDSAFKDGAVEELEELEEFIVDLMYVNGAEEA